MCVDLVVVRVCVCSALCSSLFFFFFLEGGGAFCSPWLSHGFERYELKKGQFFGGHSSLSVSNTLYMCACVLPSSITAACRTKKKTSALLRFLTSLYFLLLAFITSLICSSHFLFFFFFCLSFLHAHSRLVYALPSFFSRHFPFPFSFVFYLVSNANNKKKKRRTQRCFCSHNAEGTTCGADGHHQRRANPRCLAED